MKAIKILPLLTLCVLFTVSAFAQAPRDGALIKVDNSQLILNDNQEVKTTVELVRSKRFSKTKIEGIKVQEVDGLQLTLSPTDTKDTYELSVVANGAATGDYHVVLDGMGRWRSKIRSSMITVTVQQGAQISKN